MSIQFGPVAVLNSRGLADYEKGIRADYPVKDDTSRQLGDPREAMLKKALEVLSAGIIQPGSP